MNSKFITTLVVVVVLSYASNLTASEPAWTSITVRDMCCQGCAKKIASRLYAVRGVKEVRVEMNKKTLFVVPQQQQNTPVSPRAIWEAVEKAKDVPLRLVGPGGTFTEKPKF